MTVQGMNFVVPITIAREFIDAQRIDPFMNEVSLIYEAALDLYDDKRYKQALVKFNDVKAVNATYPFIDIIINETQAKADEWSSDLMWYGVGVLALLSILVWRLSSEEEQGNQQSLFACWFYLKLVMR